MAPGDGDGLLRAYLLDGRGGGAPLDWAGVRSWRPADGLLWVHLDFEHPAAVEWLGEHAGIDDVARDALLADATRPRSLVMRDGLLVVLRGVNLNPGAEPEDMVSVRLWVDATHVVSTGRRRLMAVQDLAEAIGRGEGPSRTDELLTDLAENLLERMDPVLEALLDTVDDVEERAATDEPAAVQSALADLRSEVIALRRHLAPQREAMARLAASTGDQLDAHRRTALQELAEQITRHVENLEELRDRTTVVHDLLASRQSEMVNHRMLVLSIVAAVFLPLSFLTGLLGINVGGIPGTDDERAFFEVCAMILVLGAVEILVLRRLKWF